MGSRLFVQVVLCFTLGFLERCVSSVNFNPTRVTQLSWSPRLFMYKGFLSNEECDHLISLAKGKLTKSMVADEETGKSVESSIRTSTGMFLLKEQDKIVADIEARIAAWTFFPKENGEDLQVLRYQNGQKYEPHVDFFEDKVNLQFGGHRAATVLMYLSDVKKGGETVFPYAAEGRSQLKYDNLSDCAKGGFSVKPMKGDAVLFFSIHPNATTDGMSLHGSCPVIEGEKWSATKWIHVKPYEFMEDNDLLNDLTKKSKGGCVDENKQCPGWAKAGECNINPSYMERYCKKSCELCQ